MKIIFRINDKVENHNSRGLADQDLICRRVIPDHHIYTHSPQHPPARRQARATG